MCLRQLSQWRMCKVMTFKFVNTDVYNRCLKALSQHLWILSQPDPYMPPDRSCTCATLNRDEKEASWLTGKLYFHHQLEKMMCLIQKVRLFKTSLNAFGKGSAAIRGMWCRGFHDSIPILLFDLSSLLRPRCWIHKSRYNEWAIPLPSHPCWQFHMRSVGQDAVVWVMTGQNVIDWRSFHTLQCKRDKIQNLRHCLDFQPWECCFFPPPQSNTSLNEFLPWSHRKHLSGNH